MCILCSGALGLMNIQSGHNWGDDFALYINQGKSIVDGTISEVVYNNTFTVKNSTIKYDFSPTVYPWGWPILLSIVYYFAGLNITCFKILGVFFWTSFQIVLLRLYSKSISFLMSALLVSIFSFSFLLIDYAANNILTEIPYLFFSTLSLIYIINCTTDEVPIKRDLAITGLLIYVSCLVRPEGVLLLGAYLGSQIYYIIVKRDIKNRQSRILSTFITLMIFLIFFFISKLILPTGYSSYLENIRMISLETIGNNLLNYFIVFQRVLFDFSLGSHVLVYLIILFICIGIAKSWKQNIQISIYFLLLCIVSVIWPAFEGRYAFLRLPFCLSFFVSGLTIFKPLFPTNYDNLFALLFAGFVVINLQKTVRRTFEYKSHPHPIIEGPETNEAKEMFSYILNNTRGSDTIAFFKPRAFTLFTERKSLIIDTDIKDVTNKCTYIVYAKKYGFYNQVAILSKADKDFAEVFSNDLFEVFRIVK